MRTLGRLLAEENLETDLPQTTESWEKGPLDLRDNDVLWLTQMNLGADSPATLEPGKFSIAIRSDWAQTSATHRQTTSLLMLKPFRLLPW